MSNPSPLDPARVDLTPDDYKARRRSEHDVYMLHIVIDDLWRDYSSGGRLTLVHYLSDLRQDFARISALIDRIELHAQEIIKQQVDQMHAVQS